MMMVCQNQNLYLVVETACPLPRPQPTSLIKVSNGCCYIMVDSATTPKRCLHI
jgi:hypothetical protein